MPSGSTAQTPFAFYDPDTCSWRTSQLSLLGDSTGSSVTWPRWGTWDAGAAYEAPMSVHHTDANGSSSLLPTPNSAKAGNDTTLTASGDGRDKPNKLGWAIALLPTPTAQEPGGTVEAHLERKNRIDGANRTTPTHLALTVQLLPTPQARDGEHGTPSTETAQDRLSAGKRNLDDAVRLLPTPRTTDGTGPEPHGEGGPSLRTAIALLPTPTAADSERWSLTYPRGNPTLLGASMPQPSDGGKPSTGQLPLPETTRDG